MATEKRHLVDIDACGRYVAGRMGFNPKKAEDVMAYLADFSDKHTVDAVEVVRCKDCLWFEVEPDDQLGICHCGYIATNHGGEIYPERSHFCSYGERRTE